jgi:hypothetical protein
MHSHCDSNEIARAVPVQRAALLAELKISRRFLVRSEMEKSSQVAESLAAEVPERKDRGRRHAVRNTALSRSLLQTLERLGESVRELRKFESELRATLKPNGALGRLLFDRFWASYLRLVLVARLEEGGLSTPGIAAKNLIAAPSLREGAVPILVFPENADACKDDAGKGVAFDADVFRRLGLIARYDRSAAREMYRTMSLLLIMRDEGETGLEKWVRATAGIKNGIGEDSKNG